MLTFEDSLFSISVVFTTFMFSPLHPLHPSEHLPVVLRQAGHRSTAWVCTVEPTYRWIFFFNTASPWYPHGLKTTPDGEQYFRFPEGHFPNHGFPAADSQLQMDNPVLKSITVSCIKKKKKKKKSIILVNGEKPFDKIQSRCIIEIPRRM